MRVQPNLSKPLGCGQLAVDTAVLLSTISGGIPAGTAFALIDAEGQNVRWRDDATAPTASVGKRIIKDSGDLIYDGDLTALKLIGEAAGGKVNVAFYGFRA
jgi:hypothetical protein